MTNFSIEALDQDIWPLPPTRKKVPDQSRMLKYGEFNASGEVMMRDVLERIWGDVNKKDGTAT